jgi:hypothetical protein
MIIMKWVGPGFRAQAKPIGNHLQMDIRQHSQASEPIKGWSVING